MGFLSLGLGDLLQESASIAFDTARGMFVNPITGTDYGPTAPAGGWPISWYAGSGGQVTVPVGAGAVSQTQAAADALKATVTQQLAAPSNTGVTTPAAPITIASALPAGASDFLSTYKWPLLGAAVLGIFLMGRKR